MSRREQIMESGCMEDYRHSLMTEGDMTYSDPNWTDREPAEPSITTIKRLAHCVEIGRLTPREALESLRRMLEPDEPTAEDADSNHQRDETGE